jgi:O-antigen/teichoic acid export membrane protein
VSQSDQGVVRVQPVPGPDGAPPTAEPAPSAAGAGSSVLFGRGMLYVAVWSLQLVGSLLVSPVLAHLLVPAQYGQLASAIALNQVLVVLAVVGLDQVLGLVRAERNGAASARALVVLGLGTACALTGLAAVAAPWWSAELGFDEGSRILLITIAWTPPAAALQLIGVVLLAEDRLKAFSVITVLGGIGGQVVGLAFLLVSGSRLASSYAAGGLVTLSVTLVAGLLMVRPRWRGVGDAALARRALRLGIPLMVGALAIYVLNAGDRLIIQRLLGSAEAGRYQIAYTIGNLAVLLLSVTSGVWAPRIAAIRDLPTRWAVIGAARDGLMRLLSPVLLGMTLGSPLLLLVVAPPSYAPAELLPVVFLVALAGFPVAAGISTGRALITLEATGAVALASIVAAAANVALNLLLVPDWGLSGAAGATVLAFTLQAVVQSVALSRRATLPSMRPAVWLTALAAVVAAAATLLLPATLGWELARAGVALVCVPWLLVELRALRRADAELPVAP